jgi:hypothetical protein
LDAMGRDLRWARQLVVPASYARKLGQGGHWDHFFAGRGHKTEGWTGDCSGNTIPTQISTILSYEVFCVLVVL